MATSPRKWSSGRADFPSKSDALLRSMSTLPKTSTDPVDDHDSPELPAAPTHRSASPVQWWWRIGDITTLGVYSAVVFWTVQYHERWADEAPAWLIARHLDLRTIWFHEIFYEGAPGLFAHHPLGSTARGEREGSTVSCFSAIVILSLYAHSNKVMALYQRPGLPMLTRPLILYWTRRIWLKAHRGKLNEDPVILAMRDPVSYRVAAAGLGIIVVSSFKRWQ